ncbi:MAG: MraY family glycosyltransferase [Bacillota bacterium]
MSLSVSAALTPAVRALAARAGLYKMPCERSVHDVPVPTMGGLAIFAGFAASCALFVKGKEIQLAPVLAGCFLALILGAVDDLRGLSPRAKLAGQIAIGTIAWLMGISIDFITRPGGGLILLGWLSYPVTVLWIVAIMNVINLIDGLDGLAAGITAIACFALMVIDIMAGQAHAVIMTASLAGCTLGFLPYNFNPARIFMGDAGSMFLGFALAAISVEGTLKSATATALAVPIMVLGVPILDTGFAVVRRIVSGRPISEADKCHIHHQLLQKGFSQRGAVLTLYAVSLVLSVGAVIVFRSSFLKGALLAGCLSGSLIIGASKAGILELTAGNPKKREP